MSEASKTKNTGWYVHSLITILLMFGFGYIVPPFGSITDVGMKVLGVFLGMLWGWIFVEILWPSVLGIFAFGMTGYTTISEAISAGFGDSTVLTVFMAILFAELLNQCHITDYIANKCLSSKWIVGKPWALVVMFFVADFLLSIFTSNVAACFLLWAAFVKVAEAAGYEKGNKFVSYMICGIIYIGVISLMVMPFRTAALVFVGFLTSGTGLTVGYGPYTIYMLILCIVQIIVYLLIGKFILRFDLSALEKTADIFADKRGSKMNFEQKFGMAFVVVFMAILFLPAFLPQSLGITKFLNNWGLIGASALLLTVAAIVKKPDGKQLANIRDVCKQGIAWDIIWLLVATYPLASAMQSQDCGIMATVLGAIQPHLGAMNPTLFMIICMVVLGIATQFVHNVVLAAMFIPMMCTLCIDMGGNPIVMFFLLYMALQCAYATPGASMQGAMMFGNQWLGKHDGFFYGILFLIMTYIIMIIVGIPLGNIIF